VPTRFCVAAGLAAMGTTLCTAGGFKVCCNDDKQGKKVPDEVVTTFGELTVPMRFDAATGNGYGQPNTAEQDSVSDLSAGVDSQLGDPDSEDEVAHDPSMTKEALNMRKSVVPPKKMNILESRLFLQGLEERGLDVSVWSQEKLDRLFWESHKQQRCMLTQKCPSSGRIKRVLRLVKIRILSDIFGVEHVLFSRLQISIDGSTQHRKQLPLRRLAWKTPEAKFDFDDPKFCQEAAEYTEDWAQGCKRALKDRLGLSFAWQQQHLEEDKFAHTFRIEDNVESASYPGLLSCYAIHEIVFRVSDATHPGVQCLGLPSGQEFATTEGNFEVSYDGGRTNEEIGSQLNLWTWERFTADGKKYKSEATSRNPIKRVPIPSLSGKVLVGIRSRAHRRSADMRPPSLALRVALESRQTDWSRVSLMAGRISDAAYSLSEFYSDLAVFPELDLYLLDGDVVPAALRNMRSTAASSGRTIGDEYQRTVGAFFAIYWLMRLDVDGKEGFSFGVDDEYRPIRPDAGEDRLYPAEKRVKFYRESQWNEFQALMLDAELLVRAADGSLKANPTRVMTLLALTAVHDIMKVQTLLPTVQPEHAPYHDYAAGDMIGDHDEALSYVMDYYPELLPSFNGLSDEEKKSVQFTQCEICFNQGWLVQAEAPPGTILTRFRETLKRTDMQVRKRDVALYFVHWVTDLAGAEPTPLGGCEKFVIKFPLQVLNSFLRSFKVVTLIATQTETQVMEDYLTMRWREHMPSLGPVPKGDDALVKLRLLCMAQTNSEPLLKALALLSKEDLEVLCAELSRTGCLGQSFSAPLVPKSVRATPQGPAFLVYYGPAYLQSLGSDDPVFRLGVLAEVFRLARSMWPASAEEAGKSVTVRIDAIKACSDNEMQQAERNLRVWAMVKKNNSEAMVEGIALKELEGLKDSNIDFRVLALKAPRRASKVVRA